MDPRLDAIESRLEQLTATLTAVERRLSALEVGAGSPGTATGWETEPPGAEGLLSAVPEATTLLTLAGRALLALGGAFLIRAVTESQVLPPAVGIALGGAYAFLWVFLADRAAAAGQRGEAMVRGTLAAAIGAPLAWEAAARFQAVSPAVAVSGLGLLALTLLAGAWRRDLQLLAWVGSLAAAGGGLALLLSTRALVSVDVAWLVLGGATAWLAYGRHGWRGPRWPLAAVADLGVWVAVDLATRVGGPPAVYQDLSLRGAWILAVLLLAGYLGSFTLHTLVGRRDITAFEVVQGAAALLIGLGGAIAVARAAGSGLLVTGLAATVLGLLTYGAAFSLLEAGNELKRSFRFCTAIALVAVLWGSSQVASGVPRALAWAAVGVIAMLLAVAYRRLSLGVHGALLSLAAGLAAGLPAAVWHAFLVPPPSTSATPILALAGVTVGAVLSYLLLAPLATGSWLRRLPLWGPGLVGVLGLAVLAVSALGPLLDATVDGARLALARTLVLAGAAVLLAVGRRLARFAPLGALAPATLVALGVKLVVEDLPRGRPATQFVAFAVSGVALLLVARLGRRRTASAGPGEVRPDEVPGEPSA